MIEEKKCDRYHRSFGKLFVEELMKLFKSLFQGCSRTQRRDCKDYAWEAWSMEELPAFYWFYSKREASKRREHIEELKHAEKMLAELNSCITVPDWFGKKLGCRSVPLPAGPVASYQ